MNPVSVCVHLVFRLVPIVLVEVAIQYFDESNELTKQTFKMLKDFEFFKGNVEGSDIFNGSVDVITFIKSYENAGFEYVISTDIAKDGMLSGPSFSLYERIMGATSIPLIASGGISGIEDLKRLKKMGLSGAIVGKAYYEGLITLDEMKEVSDAC